MDCIIFVVNMGKTTVSVSEETVKRLNKVKGMLMAEDGKNRSLEDVINELIDYFETYATEMIK